MVQSIIAFALLVATFLVGVFFTYIYSLKHSGHPAWHPHQVFVLACLGARFLLSGVLQLCRELAGIDRRVYGGH